jgi:hypothetical protein
MTSDEIFRRELVSCNRKKLLAAVGWQSVRRRAIADFQSDEIDGKKSALFALISELMSLLFRG